MLLNIQETVRADRDYLSSLALLSQKILAKLPSLLMNIEAIQGTSYMKIQAIAYMDLFV